MKNKPSQEKSKSLMAQLFANSGNLEAAAKHIGVSPKTAKELVSSSYMDKHPEVKDWKTHVFTKEDISREKLTANLHEHASMPKALWDHNAPMAKVRVDANIALLKLEGHLSENKNVSVNFHADYTVKLQQALKKRDQILDAIDAQFIATPEKSLPSPTNHGDQPTNDEKGS